MTTEQILDIIQLGIGFLGLVGGFFSWVVWKRRKKFEANLQADTDKKIEAFKAEQNEKVQKVIETHKAELQTKVDISSQALSEKITRRSKVFDLTINKQYEFYEKVGHYIGRVILSVNDMKSCLLDESGLVPFVSPVMEEVKPKFQTLNKITDEVYACRMEYYLFYNSDISVCLSDVIEILNEFRGKTKEVIEALPKHRDGSFDAIDEDMTSPCMNLFEKIEILMDVLKDTMATDVNVLN